MQATWEQRQRAVRARIVGHHFSSSPVLILAACTSDQYDVVLRDAQQALASVAAQNPNRRFLEDFTKRTREDATDLAILDASAKDLLGFVSINTHIMQLVYVVTAHRRRGGALAVSLWLHGELEALGADPLEVLAVTDAMKDLLEKLARIP